MQINADPIVITACARTPIGSFQGELSPLTAPQLGAAAIQATLKRSGLSPEQIDTVLMGCVLPAGQGQAPGRQAALKAGLAQATTCTTVNKMCGSGMYTVMLAHDALLAGSSTIAIAGGMESMSNAPYILAKARAGYRLGHAPIYDHMMLDGLEDANGKAMGNFGEDCAAKYQFNRTQQDEYAARSIERAQLAVREGLFAWEMTSIEVPAKKAVQIIDSDEGPRRSKIESIATLKPAFKKEGTITAASSSSISDGAASLMLMRRSTAQKLGLRPLARILAHSTHAQAPEWFTTAPIEAVRKLLNILNWKTSDVDLWEINEAFAVVPMALIHDLQLPVDKVNIYGGACVLGHPVGASGARIMITLLNALRQRQQRRGIASLCIGGGEATAIALELE